MKKFSFGLLTNPVTLAVAYAAIWLLILSLLGGCGAKIKLTMENGECGTVQADYESARKAAISMTCEGMTVLTGEVITDDPAAVVEALGKAASPVKDN